MGRCSPAGHCSKVIGGPWMSPLVRKLACPRPLQSAIGTSPQSVCTIHMSVCPRVHTYRFLIRAGVPDCQS